MSWRLKPGGSDEGGPNLDSRWSCRGGGTDGGEVISEDVEVGEGRRQEGGSGAGGLAQRAAELKEVGR